MKLRLLRPTTLQAIAIALTGLSSIIWLPTVGAHFARFAMTLLAAAVWIGVWAVGGVERFRRPHWLLFVGIGLGIISVIVSSVASRFPELALTYGGHTGVSAPYWISLLVIMAMSSRVTISGSTINALKWQFAWAIPVALICIGQALLGREVAFAYDNVDILAPMMLVFAPLALGMAEVSPQRGVLWRAASVVFVIAVLMSRTLSGLIGLSVVVFFTAWFAPGLLRLRGWVRYAIVGSLGSGLVLFLIFSTLYVSDSLPQPVARWATSSDFGTSAATRVEMWRVGGREVSANLLVGVGPDQFAFEGQRYFSRQFHVLEHYSSPDVEIPPDPHSLIILLPVDFGILGSLAALLIAVAWGLGVTHPPPASQGGSLLRWSFALGALGFGYTSLFTPFPLLFGGFPLLVSGLALVRTPLPRPWPNAVSYARPRVVAAIGALVLAVLLGGSAVLGRAAFSTGMTDAAAGHGIRNAAAIQPQIAFYRFALLWQQGAALPESADPAAYLAYQDAVDSASRGVRGYAPYLVELVRLSTVDARRTGRADMAWERARLADARKLSPHLPETTVELAHAEIAAGNLDRAAQLLAEASPWRDSVPEHQEYERLLNARRQ